MSMNITFGDVPASVTRGRACAVCWTDIWNPGAGCYQQTLDGVTRMLCGNCATRFQPVVLPGQKAQSEVVHLDAAAMVREVEERKRRERDGEPSEAAGK